ncbi:C4-dicarboxylate ABC transporter [Pseudooceanicola sediminis]|mgnify:CR=1 FL=1|uniref:C4-dicarboxylate ABC transporter n=1 Tax=Pseudooceanicola sediminis TaxID=2211117 RepID=A0A399J0I3_9RHOB|nr:sialic acid TRAP transporter substrate-binding protein SiaP [Pseudooceanicola sediminis]KAA2316036.1 C4-dicarboxylate ABC transporter [Puniceibacterium sp. HSS470]RII38147.1 C4-dicarboxylate ABC transporter [Pseudooceanicola sediminis]|tara:strand:- start:16362 stop:17348 length:987 start_codon:yes stop_codon:yes gene_type:complete
MALNTILRTLAVATTATFVAAMAGQAQDKTQIMFSDVTTPDVPRSQAMTEIFAKEIGDEFEFKPFFNGTLIKQGTELVAIQRGNLQMAILPPSDFAQQVPAFDILGAAYVVRDAAHLKRIFDSEVGETFRALAREKLKVEILAPAYYGRRQVNVAGDKEINTPADMAGIKMRMPGGDSWQFLGKAIGANPVPIPYAEVYTALQTNVIDAQDNPLPNDKAMKFYEVTDQIVLTSHNVGFGMLIVGTDLFDSLTPEQQARMRSVASKAFDWSTEQYLQQEEELVSFFEGEGLKVYTPDVDAFRAYAQEQYLNSDMSEAWPEGMLEQINAL